jgi:hypothetical protein
VVKAGKEEGTGKADLCIIKAKRGVVTVTPISEGRSAHLCISGRNGEPLRWCRGCWCADATNQTIACMHTHAHVSHEAMPVFKMCDRILGPAM